MHDIGYKVPSSSSRLLITVYFIELSHLWKTLNNYGVSIIIYRILFKILAIAIHSNGKNKMSIVSYISTEFLNCSIVGQFTIYSRRLFKCGTEE